MGVDLQIDVFNYADLYRVLAGLIRLGMHNHVKKLFILNKQQMEIGERLTSYSISRPNPITNLPDIIGKFWALTELKIVSNSLTQLPDSMKNLYMLKCLRIHYTSIKHLPEVVSKLFSLQVLTLRGSFITSLPFCLAGASNLRILDVSYCPNLKFVPPALSAIDGIKIMSGALENRGLVLQPFQSELKGKFELILAEYLKLRLEEIKKKWVAICGGSEDIAGIISGYEFEGTDSEMLKYLVESPRLNLLAFENHQVPKDLAEIDQFKPFLLSRNTAVSVPQDSPAKKVEPAADPIRVASVMAITAAAGALIVNKLRLT